MNTGYRVSLLLISIFGTCLFLSNCQSETKREAGICISFDDRSVREWQTLSGLLDQYNAKVTFFVAHFDSLHEQEIEILKELKGKGHEIGSHGALHVISENYISEYGYTKYLQNEVDQSITSMATHDLRPNAFAYPYGAKYWFTDLLLLKRFKVLRGVAIKSPKSTINEVDDMFASEGQNVVAALGFDYGTRLTIEHVKDAIYKAVEEQEVALFYGHYPGMDTTDAYTFDIRFLEQILSLAEENDLHFYLMSELAE